MTSPDPAIRAMQSKACELLTERARLSNEMTRFHSVAGFEGLVAAVQAELRRIAQEHKVRGWVG